MKKYRILKSKQQQLQEQRQEKRPEKKNGWL